MADHDPWGDADFEQSVREAAYFLWESDGSPVGREKEYWFKALERSLREREADALLRQAPQADDNVDEYGKPLNGGKPLDQPT